MTIVFNAVPAGTTLYIPFATYGADGASLACTGLAVTDIEIYKNGSTTQRASDNGYTLLDTDGIDFDGITGINGFSVDLSDNTTAGFYSVGAWYWVVVSAITVDSQTVNFIPAVFRVAPAEEQTGYPKTDMEYIGGVLAEGDTAPDVTVASIANNAITAASIATDAITEIQAGLATTAATASGSALSAVAIELASVQADVTAILANTVNLPSDPADQSLIMAEFAKVLEDLGFVLARETGGTSTAQSVTPAYTITRRGVTYTTTFANATSAGNRDAATLATS